MEKLEKLGKTTGVGSRHLCRKECVQGRGRWGCTSGGMGKEKLQQPLKNAETAKRKERKEGGKERGVGNRNLRGKNGLGNARKRKVLGNRWPGVQGPVQGSGST